ncbi:MAG: glycine cleavage system aminomethyltransferase GcvT [Bacteroidota bacterium]|nr:glycine cleavage system aminomethyltransferase GcvT [Bacteroidota bacterium]
MAHTALFSKHQSLNAKIVPFAGFDMPVSYTGIVDEHNAVRNAVGMFDVSHMGEFIVEGEHALALLQEITTNDVTQLFAGRVQYSCFPNGNKGIVDDLLVYQMDENKYLLVVNAGNIAKDWAWVNKHNEKYNCTLTDLSDGMSLLAVQGPKAIATLSKLTTEDLTQIPYYHFKINTLAGVDNVIISCTGYTGSGGFELYMPNDVAEQVWDAVMEAGEEFGIKPTGLGCRDTLRLEMGYCLYGNDIDDTTSPIAAGLGWITKFNKEFVNKVEFEAEKQHGSARKLVGLKFDSKIIPRQGFDVVNDAGETVGTITSGTMSPSLNYPIAMAYVNAETAKSGAQLQVKIREKLANCEVVKFPFYKV